MGNQDTIHRILEYLKKKGPTNTFNLATRLGIDRDKILNILKKLEKKEAIKSEYGNIVFLKFPKEERKIKKAHKPKKIVQVKKIAAKRKPSKKLKHFIGDLQDENKRLKKRFSELEGNIKEQSALEHKIKTKVKHIAELKKRVKELEQAPQAIKRTITKKVPAKPKIIRKTVIKKVPKIIVRRIKVPPKIIRRTVVKRVYIKVKEKPKKFKLPKLDITWMKNIQQLKKPEFMEQKIVMGKPKLNFAWIK